MDPYRTTSAGGPAGATDLEPEMVLGLLVLFVASAARVAGALVHHEVFEAEATLASFGVALALAGFASVFFAWLRRRAR